MILGWQLGAGRSHISVSRQVRSGDPTNSYPTSQVNAAMLSRVLSSIDIMPFAMEGSTGHLISGVRDKNSIINIS